MMGAGDGGLPVIIIMRNYASELMVTDSAALSVCRIPFVVCHELHQKLAVGR